MIPRAWVLSNQAGGTEIEATGWDRLEPARPAPWGPGSLPAASGAGPEPPPGPQTDPP